MVRSAGLPGSIRARTRTYIGCMTDRKGLELGKARRYNRLRRSPEARIVTKRVPFGELFSWPRNWPTDAFTANAESFRSRRFRFSTSRVTTCAEFPLRESSLCVDRERGTAPYWRPLSPKLSRSRFYRGFGLTTCLGSHPRKKPNSESPYRQEHIEKRASRTTSKLSHAATTPSPPDSSDSKARRTTKALIWHATPRSRSRHRRRCVPRTYRSSWHSSQVVSRFLLRPGDPQPTRSGDYLIPPICTIAIVTSHD